jgi:membrane-associated phospholipid phosphatase
VTDAPHLPAGPAALGGPPEKRALGLLLGSGMLIFGVLGILVALRWTPLINTDAAATAAAYRAARAIGWLRAGARGVTTLGSPAAVDVIAAGAVLFLALARRWSLALAVAAARLGELGVEGVIKAVVDRPRPVFSPPLATAQGASFPSGHAAGSAVVYVVLLLLVAPRLARHWRGLLAVAVLLLVLAIAASRVLLGVHYPSDVVAGLALGWGCAAAAVRWSRPGARPPWSRRRGTDPATGKASSEIATVGEFPDRRGHRHAPASARGGVPRGTRHSGDAEPGAADPGQRHGHDQARSHGHRRPE